jgi:hypothetical protein
LHSQHRSAFIQGPASSFVVIGVLLCDAGAIACLARDHMEPALAPNLKAGHRNQNGVHSSA